MNNLKVNLNNTENIKYIILIFAFIFTFFATSRSIVPRLSFSAISIMWLLSNSPFFYHKKLILHDDKNIILLLFAFVVCLSGAINFGHWVHNASFSSFCNVNGDTENHRPVYL